MKTYYTCQKSNIFVNYTPYCSLTYTSPQLSSLQNTLPNSLTRNGKLQLVFFFIGSYYA